MKNRIAVSLSCLLAGAVVFPVATAASPDQVDLSLSHVMIGDADLDKGGELGSDHTDLSVKASWSRDRGESVGLSLGATMRNYDFGGISTLAAGDPWGDVTETSIGASWRRPFGDSGMLFIAPSLGVAREDGADWGDSIRFGTVVSYGYRISDTLTIGVGAGVFTGLEETSAFPVLLVDWRINENWRLGNPFRPGPSGPAGLEIAYAPNADWEFALGAGWRSNRFRLDEDGLVPDGIGEVEGVPVFLRLSWMASPSLSLDLYAGQFLAGEVNVENSKGKTIASDDLDSAAMAGLSVSWRF